MICSGLVSRSVQRRAWGLNSSLGSRINTQRTGTAGNPVEYHTAVWETTSTARSPSPYQWASVTGVHTISPTSPLPLITEPVIINGYSQAGSSANTLAKGTNAVLTIELDGSKAGSAADGLSINAKNTVVKGLVINS